MPDHTQNWTRSKFLREKWDPLYYNMHFVRWMNLVILIPCRSVCVCEFDKLYRCVVISNDIITVPMLYYVLLFLVCMYGEFESCGKLTEIYMHSVTCDCGLNKPNLTFQVLRIAARWQCTLCLAIKVLGDTWGASNAITWGGGSNRLQNQCFTWKT